MLTQVKLAVLLIPFSFVACKNSGQDSGVQSSGGGTETNGTVSSLKVEGVQEGQNINDTFNLKVTTTSFDSTGIQIFLNSSATTKCSSATKILNCSISLNDLILNADNSIKITLIKNLVPIETKIIRVKTYQLGNNICKDGSNNNINITTCLTNLKNAGLIAGYDTLYYQNLDNKHTNLSLAKHPLINYNYGGNLGMWNFYGGNNGIGYNQSLAVVGNASLCMGSPECMSVVRNYLSDTASNYWVFYNQLYLKNSAYWHPEHQDLDAVEKLWFMVPFASLSQGSSGSEMDEVDKFLWATAALKPEVYDELITHGLLAPTLQMIHRRSRVATNDDYLTYKAHPSAFNNFSNEYSMIRMANEIEVTNIPPMISLSVISETFESPPSSDYRGFDTSTAIARLRVTNSGSRKIRVSAQNSYDINGHSLTYHWGIVHGTSSEIKITPLNANHSEVEIEFEYVASRSVASGDVSLMSKLSAVAVVVHNGTYYSAPGFVTSYSGKRNAY